MAWIVSILIGVFSFGIYAYDVKRAHKAEIAELKKEHAQLINNLLLRQKQVVQAITDDSCRALSEMHQQWYDAGWGDGMAATVRNKPR